jgi:hypothetical protein
MAKIYRADRKWHVEYKGKRYSFNAQSAFETSAAWGLFKACMYLGPIYHSLRARPPS